MDNPVFIYIVIIPAYFILAGLVALAELPFTRRVSCVWRFTLTIPVFLAGNTLYWIFFWVVSTFEGSTPYFQLDTNSILFGSSLIGLYMVLLIVPFACGYKLNTNKALEKTDTSASVPHC